MLSIIRRSFKFIMLLVLAIMVVRPFFSSVVSTTNEALVTEIDMADYITSIRTDTAAGVFGLALFEAQQLNPKSIGLQDIPQQHNFEQIFAMKSMLDEKYEQATARARYHQWVDTTEISDRYTKLRRAVEDKLSEVEEFMSENTDVPSDYRKELETFRSQLQTLQKAPASKLSSCESDILNTKNNVSPFCQAMIDTYSEIQYQAFYEAEETLFDKAVEVCENKFEDDLLYSCEAEVLASDYEAEYQHSGLIPISLQTQMVQTIKLTKSQKLAIETKLTDLLETIRIQLQSRLDDGARSKLHPVEVKIGGEGLNVHASTGDTKLRIPLDLLRDVYFRSFHRALVNYSYSYGDAIYEETIEALDFLSYLDSDNSGFSLQLSGQALSGVYGLRRGIYEEAMSYSLTVEHFLSMLGSVQGIKSPFLSTPWLAQEMQSITALVPQDEMTWFGLLGGLEDSDKPNALEVFDAGELDYVISKLAEYAPDSSRDAELRKLHQHMVTMSEWLDGDDVTLESMEVLFPIYAGLYSEVMVVAQSASAEMLKSYLFILAHESWHLWFGNEVSTLLEFKNEEYLADEHAMRVYLDTYKSIDLDQWSNAISGESFGTEDGEMKTFFENISGRDPDKMLIDVFKNTDYYQGSFSHPKIEDRASRMRTQVAAGRKEFTDASLLQLMCQLDSTYCQNLPRSLEQ